MSKSPRKPKKARSGRRHPKPNSSAKTVKAGLPAQNYYLEEFERFLMAFRAKRPWLDYPGLRGWLAWKFTYVPRLLTIMFGSLPMKNTFGQAIPNETALARLGQFQALIEIGAGLGYWTWLLRARRVDILAFDKYPMPGQEGSWHPAAARTWTIVEEGDASILLKHPTRTLFLCYPDKYNTMASDCLKAYTGDMLAYVATARSIAVGDNEFHVMLDLDCELIEAIPIPGWLDLHYRYREQVPIGKPWSEVSHWEKNYGDHLFIFLRK